jgi:lipopolysaccharide/colanic/teichoic acid biosynthesis glycosyltransferase
MDPVSHSLERTKRLMDIALSSAGLVVALPVMAAVACLIALEDGLPVVYKQPRVGRGGAVYDIYKFRSMRVNNLHVMAVGQVNEEHPLVTRVGKFIRRYKLDELPQLLNVLLGDMSIIGPRPTYKDNTDRYSPLQRRRLEVRPGITGWAQVSGGTAYSWDDRILLDLWYIDHLSLGLELRILLKTIPVVLFGERPDAEALRLAKQNAADWLGQGGAGEPGGMETAPA